MNNPFGLPDELFGAILASAITGRNEHGKQPFNEEPAPGST